MVVMLILLMNIISCCYADLTSNLLLLEDQLNVYKNSFKSLIPVTVPISEIPSNFLISKKLFENTYPLLQLKVYNQFAPDGGGAASCGYHALKNGWYITQALVANDQVQKNRLFTDLQNKEIIKELFGTQNSLWRKRIIQNRRGGDGEWLNGEEIELLAQSENIPVNEVQKMPRYGITVFQDISMINNQVESGRILPLLQAIQDPKAEFIHIIVIGSMKQVGDNPRQAAGHWITVVIQKKNEPKNITFFLANSAHNNDSLSYEYVTTLLSFLITTDAATLQARFTFFALLEEQIKNIRNYLLGYEEKRELIKSLNTQLNNMRSNYLTTDAVIKNLIAELNKQASPFMEKEWQTNFTVQQWKDLMNTLLDINGVITGPLYDRAKDNFVDVLYMQLLLLLVQKQLGLLENKNLKAEEIDPIRQLLEGKRRGLSLEKRNILNSFLTQAGISLDPISSYLLLAEKSEIINNLDKMIRDF